MSLKSRYRPSLGAGLSFLLLVTVASVHAETPRLAPGDAKVLDFMADWQGDDGRWTDPMTFSRIDPAKVKADEVRRHGRSLPPAVSKTAPAAGTGQARDVR